MDPHRLKPAKLTRGFGYQFEDRDFVWVTITSGVTTEEALDTLEVMIAVKRAELRSKAYVPEPHSP